MDLKDDGSVSSETTLGEASVRSVDLLLNISTQHATASKLSKALPSAIQTFKKSSLESHVPKHTIKNDTSGTNMAMNNESDQIAGNDIRSQSTTSTISPSTRMLNELSQASRAAGNANSGHLDGAGDLMFDMSQLSQLEPIRELESSIGRYELDSSKDSSRNVGKKRKVGDLTLSSSLEVKKTKNNAKANAGDAETEIPYSFHIVTFSKKSPFGINVKDESTIGTPTGSDELRLKIIEIHPDCEASKQVKTGDILFHLPPGCKNAVQLDQWVTKYMQSHFRAVGTSYRTESFGLEPIKLDELILMSKSQSRPISFVVMRDKAQEEFPTHCNESKYLQCSLNDEELRNIMKHENYPIIPCCKKCKSDKGCHHKLCPRHRDFHNSGSKHKLELYAAGAFYKCQACIFWIENGKPKKEEKHNYACTVYSASPIPTTQAAETTKRSNKNSTKKGKSSKPKGSKRTEKKTPQKKVGKKKKKEVVSKNISKSCDSETTKSPEKEDEKAEKPIKPLQKSDGRSNPKQESRKLRHSHGDNPESSENCNKENDRDNKTDTLCITDDNRFSKWVKCPNPWGDREFKDSDLVLFSPETYMSYHEIYGSSPKRFNREPFKDTNYRQTHKSQKEGGLSVLVLKRDRLALRSWGFRFCHHDFGACLVTCVEPMSPADAAVSLDCEFEKNSLSVDDMILAVDNKRVGGMTVVELEILLETAGSEITLVVARPRLQNRENLVKVSNFESLSTNTLHWVDFGASEISQKIVSTDNETIRSLSEEGSSSHIELTGEISNASAIREKLLSLEFKDIPRDIVAIPSKKKGSKFKYAYVQGDKTGTKWIPSLCVLGKTTHFRSFESEEDAARMGAWIYASLQILKGGQSAINKSDTSKMVEKCNDRDNEMGKEKEAFFVSKPKSKVSLRETLLSLEFKDIPRDIVAIPSKKKGSKCKFAYVSMDNSGKNWRPHMAVLGKSTHFRSHDSEEDAGRMAAWIYESLQKLKEDPNAIIRKDTGTSKSSELLAENTEERGSFTTEKDSSSSTIITNSNAPKSISLVRESTIIEKEEESRHIGDKSFRSSLGEDIDESSSESTSSGEGASVEPEWDDDSNPWLGCVCGQTHGSPIPVFWLQCDVCDAWYNVASKCVGFDEAKVNSTTHWSCPDCSDAESQSQNQTKDLEIRVGSIVNVEDRTWSGSNKPGGVARITNITSDSAGTTRYNVKYVLESRSEKDIDQKYVTINYNMTGQSFFSPERSTRSR